MMGESSLMATMLAQNLQFGILLGVQHPVNKPIKYILQIFLLVSVLKRDFVVPIITSANSENLKWQL